MVYVQKLDFWNLEVFEDSKNNLLSIFSSKDLKKKM
jgi:hypothetical protein